MPVYSNSRLKKFEHCPRAYKFKYLEEVEVEKVRNIYGFLGSTVHETLEFFYENLIDGRRDSLSTLLDHFNEIWNENWKENIQIQRKDRGPEHFREVGEKCVKNYYEKHCPFDRENTVETELRVYPEVEVDGSNYTFLGFIDRLAISKDGRYVIHDYKTSKNLPTKESLRNNRQLAIYQIGVQQEYPDADEVELVWHYLRFGKDFRLSFSPNEIEAIRDDIGVLLRKIEEAKKTDKFPTKRDKGARCDWCDYWHLCPEWRHYYENESLSLDDFLEEDGRIMVDRLTDIESEIKDTVRNLNNLIDKRRDLEGDLLAYADRRKLGSIYGSKKRASIEKKEENLENFLKKSKALNDSSNQNFSFTDESTEDCSWCSEFLDCFRKFKDWKDRRSVKLEDLKD
ncbi:MAG: RecB family exonuclease [Candidatus Hadarchaeia archaeon]